LYEIANDFLYTSLVKYFFYGFFRYQFGNLVLACKNTIFLVILKQVQNDKKE
jgi:hypothetical protein